MQKGGIGREQVPAAVNLEALRAEAEVLAKSFQQDRQLKGFAEKISSVLKGPGVEENLRSRVFDQLQPEDLEGKPEQLKAAQRFMSQFPSVGKTVPFGEHWVHPLLVKLGAGPTFREMFNDFPGGESEIIQSIADKLEEKPQMRALFYEYFETGTVSPTIDQIPELLRLADQFHVPGIFDIVNAHTYSVIDALNDQQLNTFLELSVKRNIGWLQLRLLDRIPAERIEKLQNANLQELVKAYIGQGGMFSLNPQGQITANIKNATQLKKLVQLVGLGLRVEQLKVRSVDQNLITAVCANRQTLKDVTSLTLDDCNINNETAQKVAEVLGQNKLTQLSLKSNRIDSIGCQLLSECIAKNNVLHTLDLSGNFIGDEGAKYLAEALEKNKNLTSLNIAMNDIHEAGGVRLGEALLINKTLRVLNLRDNQLELEGCLKFAEALKVNSSLVDLNLGHNDIRLVETQFLIDRLTGEVEVVKEHKNRKGAIFSQQMAEALEKNKTIVRLDLANTPIGDEGASRLALAIAQHPSLEHLVLAGGLVGDRGATALAQALVTNKVLIGLNLMSCHIGDAGASQIAEALIVNTTLEELYLNGQNLNNQGATQLALALMKNTTLSILGLANNDFSDEGAIRLAEALKQNRTLKKLDLRSCKIGKEGRRHLQEAEKVNHTVRIDLDFFYYASKLLA